jgi:hypothetical protein
MAVWCGADVSFELADMSTDHPVATIVGQTPAGLLFAMAEVVEAGRAMQLRGLHLHGEHAGPNDIGAANLLVLIAAFMEAMDVDELVVTGAARTTGAHPGRAMRPLRFTRQRATSLGRRYPSD